MEEDFEIKYGLMCEDARRAALMDMIMKLWMSRHRCSREVARAEFCHLEKLCFERIAKADHETERLLDRFEKDDASYIDPETGSD